MYDLPCDDEFSFDVNVYRTSLGDVIKRASIV